MDISSDQLFEDMAIHLAKELVMAGIDDKDRADRSAAIIAEKIRRHWGGQSIYIPNCRFSKNRQRDARILAEFDGNNHAALARKYGLSSMRIRQILARKTTPA